MLSSESILLDVADLYGEAFDRNRLNTYVRLLADISPTDLQAAIDAHCNDPQRGRFFPRPADIRDKCRRLEFEHPPVDAAWAIALQSMDEDESVVWTDIIEQARDVALPVWDSGDTIGARMAFRAAYQSLVDRTSQAPRWKLSVGFDASRRHDAVERAKSAGLISQDQARDLLPDLSEPTGDAAAVAGMLTGKVIDFPEGGKEGKSLSARDKALREMRAIIAREDARKTGRTT